MANAEQLEIINQGVEVWNKWRNENAETQIDLSNANFTFFDLSGICLRNANLSYSDFSMANLSHANLMESNLRKCMFASSNLAGAYLMYSDMAFCNFKEADMSDTDCKQTNFSYSNFEKVKFHGTNLESADLSYCYMAYSFLKDVNLCKSQLLMTNIEGATFIICHVFGISTWGMEGVPKKQFGIIISRNIFPSITVDDIYMAQFIHLLITNRRIANVIDSITSKAVLILGSFTEVHKNILDEIRSNLQSLDLVPILFDFTPPASKDFTGTIETLARMARFIIADLTDPRSIPHELASIVPHLRTTPVLPIRLIGSSEYSMFADYQRSYPWVLPTYEYLDGPSLIAELSKVINTANDMAEAFRSRD